MIGAIENAIINRIERTDLGYRLKSVESYKAQFDDDIEEFLKGAAPAVWIAFTGENQTEDLNKRTECTASFSVLILTRNVRNERASRHGKGGEVGAYQIVQDIKRLLHKSDLGLPIRPMKHRRTVPLLGTNINTFYTTVFALEFEVVYEFAPVPVDPEGLTDFLTLQTTWDVPELKSETTITFERGNNDQN